MPRGKKSAGHHMFLAAGVGDYDRVVQYVERKCNINYKDARKNTALHYAVKLNNERIALYLLDHGIEFRAENDVYLTPACFAAANGNLTILRKLVELGIDINYVTSEEKETILLWAAYKDRLDIVQYLLELGADVTHQNAAGHTALYYAVRIDNKHMARLLIEKGADVNQRLERGNIITSHIRSREMRSLLQHAGLQTRDIALSGYVRHVTVLDELSMDDMANELCPICCASITTNSDAQLSCKHVFHARCLLLWVISNKTCPMCRAQILAP